MERFVHRAKGFAQADEWDVAQHKRLTLHERLRQSDELKKRIFGNNPLDLRQWHRQFPLEACSRRMR